MAREISGKITLNIPSFSRQIKKGITGDETLISACMPEKVGGKPFDFPKQRDKRGDQIVRIFLTENQRQLLDNEECRLRIYGSYGTGKSLILKLKAMEVAHKNAIQNKKDQKQCKVFFAAGQYTIGDDTAYIENFGPVKYAKYFFERSKIEFQENRFKDKIEVVDFKSVSEAVELYNQGHHIFWDELPLQENAIKELSNIDKNCQHFFFGLFQLVPQCLALKNSLT